MVLSNAAVSLPRNGFNLKVTPNNISATEIITKAELSLKRVVP